MIRVPRSPLLFAASFALALSATAQGRVWVVTGALNLQSAINSAADGDAVLVKTSGDYDLITVQAKALTIVADQGVVASCTAIIRDLTPSQRVVLRGLTLLPRRDLGWYYHTALSIWNTQGSVWIEGCTIPRLPGPVDVSIPGIAVDRCADVVLLRTRSEGVQCANGNDYYDVSPQNGHGLSVRGGSRIVAHGCEFRGANGHSGDIGGYTFPLEGAAGIRTSSSSDRVFLSDCRAVGGNGTVGEWPSNRCSNGGAGLWSAGPARVLDSLTVGGPAGSSLCTSGADRGGSVQSLSGQALRFSVSTPVREGGSIHLDFHGPASTPVLLLVGSGPTNHDLRNGPLLARTPSVRFAGVTDASGDLHLIETMPSMAPGFQFGNLFLQAAYLDTSSAGTRAEHVPVGTGSRSPGRLVLGAATVLVALDASL